MFQSATSRVIGKQKFEPGQLMTFKLPLDTTATEMIVRLTGAVRTTYGSGTPVAKAESIADALINRIEVVTDGKSAHKSARPHFFHLQNILARGVQPERFSVAGAAPTEPKTEQGFVFGTTGQFTSVRESVVIPFEMVWAEPGLGREDTYLNLRNYQSAEVKIYCNQFADLLGYGNNAPVAWADSTMSIEVSILERQDIPAGYVFDEWKQIQKTQPLMGQQTDFAIDFQMANFLTGMLLYCVDGAAGSTTTATGKLATNSLLRELELKQNGRNTIQKWNFNTLQSVNRSNRSVTPTVANVSRLDGAAHMNLLSRKDLDTAFPAMKPVTDNLQLFLTSNEQGVVDYGTAGAQVFILLEELVKLQKRK